MRAALIVFGLLLSCPVFAETGVLVEHVPKGATPEVVVAIVQQAFLGREWTVLKADSTSVSATIKRTILKVNLRISFVDHSLVYDGNAQRLQAPGNPAQQQGSSHGPTDLPQNWITNLKRDISLALAAIPDR